MLCRGGGGGVRRRGGTGEPRGGVQGAGAQRRLEVRGGEAEAREDEGKVEVRVLLQRE